MNKSEFEKILNKCCAVLTAESQNQIFKSSAQFENRVREVLQELAQNHKDFRVDFNPHSQAFPDIAVEQFGVEVKFTLNDTWRSVANSVLESHRVDKVKYIYIVFGKMGGTPCVRWAEYEKSVIHVRTSHVPRFEVELTTNSSVPKESLFTQMGISYEKFRLLPMQAKMRYIRAYAKKIHPDGQLWWLGDSENAHHTNARKALHQFKSARKNKVKS